MNALPGSVVRRVFLRSFAIQASWNYRTLQGSGFAYALMPALRYLYPERAALDAAVARHTVLFNAHPYLAGVALGAVARMEADGEDPALIERFKTALRGSLGALGDRLVWAGWRPACVLLGLVVLLATSSATTAIVVFLAVYNTGHLALRWWGLQIGVKHGRMVGEQLRRAPLLTYHGRVVEAAAFLVGAALPIIGGGAMTGSVLPLPWLIPVAAAATAGWLIGGRVRTPALVLLVITAIAGLLLPLNS